MRRSLVTLLVAGLMVVGLLSHGEEAEPPQKLLDPRSILLEWRSEVADQEPERKAGRPPVETTDSALVRSLTVEGSRLVGAGQAAEGLAKFRDAIRLEPGSKSARFGLATALLRLERYPEAIKMFDGLIAEYPSDYGLKNNLAWLFATAADESVRNPERAVQLAQDALVYAGRDYRVWSTLAEAHYVLKNFSRADRAATESLRLAIEAGVRGPRLEEYRAQATKSRQAAGALSVVE